MIHFNDMHEHQIFVHWKRKKNVYATQYNFKYLDVSATNKVLIDYM